MPDDNVLLASPPDASAIITPDAPAPAQTLEGGLDAPPPDAPGAAPAPAPAPEPPPAPDPRLTELEQRLAAYEQRTQQEQAQQQQAQAQQRQQMTQKALADYRKQLLEDYAMPAEQADQHLGLIAEAVQSREQLGYVARMAPVWGKSVKQTAIYQEALQYLPETATLKDLKEFTAALDGYNDPASLQQAAKMLSQLRGTLSQAQMAQQRQTAIQSGAARIEGGGAMAPVGMSDQEFINRWAGGSVPSTPENLRRAKQLTDRGVWARSG